MSHSKERKEKICLNCNAEVFGRFCHACGQENVEPKETVWGLVSHFFYDITHFDGRFFHTLGYLVRKPGFLSKEYIRGRRASYLNPIRMYVFSSALFFIIFFSMYDVRSWKMGTSEKDVTGQDSAGLMQAKALELLDADNREDSARIEYYYNTLAGGNAPLIKVLRDSVESQKKKGWRVAFSDVEYETREQYDSAQKSKPPELRDGWLTRKLNYRFLDISRRYEGTGNLIVRDLLDKFLHTFPYLLFVSLPLYALYLRLLYIRRKQFYYVDHGMFLIHLYIFTFIVLLVFFALSKLSNIDGFRWVWALQTILLIYGVLYTLKAMRNFYGQGWGRTILKFILLNMLAFFTLIFLFSIFFIFAAFRI